MRCPAMPDLYLESPAIRLDAHDQIVATGGWAEPEAEARATRRGRPSGEGGWPPAGAVAGQQRVLSGWGCDERAGTMGETPEPHALRECRSGAGVIAGITPQPLHERRTGCTHP